MSNFQSDPYVGAVRFANGGDGSVFTSQRIVSGTILAAGTSVAIDAPGVQVGDHVLASIESGNSSGESIASAAATANTVTITMTGTPGADTVVKAFVARTES